MARSKKISEVIEHSDVSTEVAAELIAGANQSAEHSANILAQFGDGEAMFDLRLHEQKVREAMERGARAIIDTGRNLIIIKEHIGHGEWIDSLDRIGLPARAAQKMMQAAVKFLSSPGSKKVLEHAGNKSKVLELAILDEDDLEALGEGQTVSGITLDDIDRMSSSELRKALRQARDAHEDHDRVITEKNKKIDEQAKQIMRIRREPDEEAKQMRADISSLQSMVEHDIRVNLFNGINTLREHADQHDEPGSNAHQEFISSQITLLENAIAFLRENCVQGVEWE